MGTQLLAFLGVSLVVICTPGPDTALTVRNAFAGGRGCGVWTAAGVAVGQAVWTLAASLGIALANPKMAAFFLSLLPQFASSQQGTPGVLLLGLLFCLLTFGWLAGYSIAVARARRLLTRPRVRRALDTLTGGVLVAFGARLAFEQR